MGEEAEAVVLASRGVLVVAGVVVAVAVVVVVIIVLVVVVLAVVGADYAPLWHSRVKRWAQGGWEEMAK
eukprot:1956443-Pyramimonas_sp.AAC.1